MDRKAYLYLFGAGIFIFFIAIIAITVFKLPGQVGHSFTGLGYSFEGVVKAFAYGIAGLFVSGLEWIWHQIEGAGSAVSGFFKKYTGLVV